MSRTGVRVEPDPPSVPGSERLQDRLLASVLEKLTKASLARQAHAAPHFCVKIFLVGLTAPRFNSGHLFYTSLCEVQGRVSVVLLQKLDCVVITQPQRYSFNTLITNKPGRVYHREYNKIS